MRAKEPDQFAGTTEFAWELSDEQLQRLYDAMDVETAHRINTKARKEAGYTA